MLIAVLCCAETAAVPGCADAAALKVAEALKEVTERGRVCPGARLRSPPGPISPTHWQALRTSEKKRVAVCASRWSHVRLGTRLRTPVWRAHVEVMPHVRGGTVHPVYRRWLPRNWHSQDQLGVNMREGLKSTSSIRLPRSGQSVPLMFSFDFGFRNCSICISFADLVSVFPLSVHPFGVCLPFSVLSVVSSIR